MTNCFSNHDFVCVKRDLRFFLVFFICNYNSIYCTKYTVDFADRILLINERVISTCGYYNTERKAAIFKMKRFHFDIHKVCLIL